jgi:hypothetical protein
MVVGTHCGLDGSGIGSQLGWDFPHPFRLALRPTEPRIQWVQGLFPGVVKWLGCGIDHPPPSIKGKGKAIPLQALTGPKVSRKLRLPDFKTVST